MRNKKLLLVFIRAMFYNSGYQVGGGRLWKLIKGL